MSADENLNQGQFKAYRGLYLGGLRKSTWVPPGPGEKGLGHPEFDHTDPNDDQAIINRHLEQQPDPPDTTYKEHWPPYGQHWTPHKDTAEQFALDPLHGKYRTVRASRGPSYGVVLEAHTSEPPTSGRQEYENHINVPRRIVTGMTAHLYYHEGGSHLGNPAKKYIRSFPVPEEHWKNS